MCVCVWYRVCHQVDLVWNFPDPPKDTNDGTSDDGLIICLIVLLIGYYLTGLEIVLKFSI